MSHTTLVRADDGTLSPPDDIARIIDDLRARMRAADPDLRDRAQQYQMTRATARALLGGEILCVEAPTGTGKSLAYSLAAIPVMQSTRRKLVIATATVALQEQLVARDLPRLATDTGTALKAGLAKGRARYACTARAAMLCGTESAAAIAGHELNGLSSEEQATLRRMCGALGKDWDGDRDSWDAEVPDRLWRHLIADRHSCAKRRCHYIEQCPYYTARNRLRDADVIVTNHDLLLSDLVTGGGIALPKPEEMLLVIDEAHHLPRKAVARFARSLRLASLEANIQRLPKILASLTALLRDQGITQTAAVASKAAAALAGRVSRLMHGLSNYGPLQIANGPAGDVERPVFRFPNGQLPPGLTAHLRSIREAAAQVCDALGTAREQALTISESGDLRAMKAEPWVTALGAAYGRVFEATACLDLLLNDAPGTPAAKWVSVEEYHGHLDYCLQATTIRAETILNDALWSRIHAAVLTSATLTVAESFDHYARETGLAGNARACALRLGSPFDYERNAELVVPEMRTQPTDESAYIRELAERLPDIIDPAQGTLVLFPSRLQMQEVVRQLSPQWTARALLQGSMARHALLAEHARRIAAGEGSVIFGLQSFAEGLDLPGELCVHVVITRLPFAVPNNPIDEALAEWVARRGGNPFMELTIPHAALKLQQQVGRLIRRETDTGRVTILDRRIVERNYGKVLMKSLPPMRRRIVQASTPAAA